MFRKIKIKITRRMAAYLVGAVALTAFPMAGCASFGENDPQAIDSVPTSSASSQAGTPGLVGNDKDYSMTLVVNNTSSQTLTLISATADNGGSVDLAPASVGPQSSQTYVASNHGNGVELELDFDYTGDGNAIVPDLRVVGDVPKVDENWASASLFVGGLTIDSVSAARGNNATAKVSLSDCAAGCTMAMAHNS